MYEIRTLSVIDVLHLADITLYDMAVSSPASFFRSSFKCFAYCLHRVFVVMFYKLNGYFFFINL